MWDKQTCGAALQQACQIPILPQGMRFLACMPVQARGKALPLLLPDHLYTLLSAEQTVCQGIPRAPRRLILMESNPTVHEEFEEAIASLREAIRHDPRRGG